MNKEINEILKKIENNEISDSEGMKQLEAVRKRFGNVPGKNENIADSVREEFGKSDNSHFQFEFNENLLKDHLIFGEQVLMGMAHLSMAVEYIRKNYSYKNCLIKDALFSSALMLQEREIGTVSIQETDRSETTVIIESLSRKEERLDYKKNASFQLQLKEGNIRFNTLDIHSLERNTLKVIDPDIFYKHPDQACYGASLFSVDKVYEIAAGEVFGRIKLTPEMRKEHDQFYLHPALLDACHVTSTLALKGDPVQNHWVPLFIKELYVNLSLESKKFIDSYCYIKHKISNSQISEFDIQVCDPDGNVYLVFNGLTTKYVPSREALFGTPRPVKSATPQPMLRPLITVSASGDNLKSVIQEFIQSIIAGLLHVDKAEVPLDVNFMKLGLDSNNMMEAVKNIEASGVKLYATLFFEYQNINELVKYLYDEHGEKLANYFGQSPASSANSQATVPAMNENSPGTTRQQRTPKELLGTTGKKSFDQEEEHRDIAVIGMYGYLPQSRNLDEFWRHIEASDDLVSEIPLSHWDYRPWFDTDPEIPNRTYSKWGSFIDDVDKFDPTFFEISPKYAEWMDPQLRLLLQSAYKTFEDAGLVKQIRGSNTSVYVGSCFHEYWDEVVRAQTPIVDYQYWSQVMSSLSGTVSYTFDLQGASVPLDNACASSLSALHLGVQSILSGESEMSFVGGLNLLLSPLHYVHFSKLHALSPHGRCYTFDERADGYVPGEGVVSVLLKRLDRAIQDGDNIHAVIKGTAANHTGRSNNSTSPRPELQTKLLQAAWEKAQINPEDISYVDAHGTGTKLGDPIEVNALKRAFKKYTDKRHFCTIGSTKAHMGHLEGAAGLASVIKVILMMKNKKIPKMPHFEKINPLIELDNSPFTINTELVDWKSRDGKKLLAGVSSFGITGNNAHAVIEEYIPENFRIPGGGIVVNSSTPVMIPLSAQKPDRLREQAQNLLSFIQKNREMNSQGESQSSQINLADLAYTLQVGREEMKERLGLIVNSPKELEEKLQSFLDGKRDVRNLFLGQVKQNQEILSIFIGDEDHQKALETWMLKGKYGKLLNLWVKGFTFDWNKGYGENKPRRISAPTYPFAKDRCWVENLGLPPMNLPSIDFVKSGIKRHLHPLLQENTSVLSEQRFSSTFTGDEFFLRDHIVQGKRVLPGVIYLEMAYEAVVRAKNNSQQDIKNNIQLKNVIWAKPIIVDTPQEVHISLHPQDRENDSSPIINYEVYTENPNVTGERIVHCQGMATLTPSQKFQTLNLASVREKFKQNSISPRECDTLFEAMGFTFGPAHKGIEVIYVRDNEEAIPEVFAKVNLPSCVLDTQNQFTLHPSTLDASLQALIAGINIKGQHKQPMLPFVLESIEVIDKCPNAVWVCARLVPQKGKAQSGSGRIQKFDVDIYDENGKMCVKMQGFTSQVLKKDVSGGQSSKKEGTIAASAVKPVLQEKIKGKPLPASDETKTDSLSEGIQKILTELASKLLKLGVENIDSNQELSTFGFDSITLTSYGNQINRTYKLALTPTVFFEYPTIASLAKYLADEHATAFTGQSLVQDKEVSTIPHTPKEKQEQREDYQFSPFENKTVLNQYNDLEDDTIKPVVFMFSGQGSHYYHMGKDLYQKDPIFKKWLDEANDVASPILGKSIVGIMYDESKKMTDPFVQTQEACSAIVILGYAMAKFLIEKGIKPDYLLGSSLGEITACIIGGGVDLHDALSGLSKQLSLIEKKCKKGKMIGILSSPELYQKIRILNECSELAAINSRSHFVVSCNEKHTKQIENELRTQNVDFQTLPVANAYHCSLLDPVEMAFKEMAADTPFRSPSIPVVSCAHAEVVNSLSVSYLWDIYRQPIRFQDTVQMLVKQQGCIFLDAGPSGTLSSFVKSNLAEDSRSESFPILTSFRMDVANFEKIRQYFESSSEDRIRVPQETVR